MEDELEAAWQRARRSPKDVALWDGLAAAFARAGRSGEAAWRLRNLLLLAGRAPEREAAYLGLLRRHGHGVGDPGFQHGSSPVVRRSPDGRWLAVVVPPRGFVLYEARRGLVVLREDELAPVRHLSWSLDGRTVLLGGWLEDGEPPTLALAQVRAGPAPGVRRIRVPLPDLEPRDSRLLASAEGRELLVVDRDGTVATIALGEPSATGAVLGPEAVRLDRAPGDPGTPDSCVLSPDGRWLLQWRASDGAVGIRILDRRSRSWIQVPPTAGVVRGVAWSEDGAHAAVVLTRELVAPVPANPWDYDDSGTDGEYATLAVAVSLADGRVDLVEGEHTGSPEQMSAARFGPDGRLTLAGVAWDPVRRTREPRPGLPRHVPGPGRDGPLHAACTAIELSISWAGSSFLGTSSRAPTPSRRPLVHEHPIQRLQLSEDGRRLLTEEGGAKGQVWDAAAGLPLARAGFHSEVIRLARDGSAWVGAGRGYRVVPVDRPQDAIVEPVRPYQPPHQGHYDLVDLSPDGETVALRGWPWGIELIPVGDAEPRARNDKLGSSNRSLRFVDRGRKLAVLQYPSIEHATVLHVLAVADLAVLESIELVKLDWSQGDADLAELPDGSGLVVGAPGGPLLCRYGSPRAERLVTRRGAPGPFALAPDGAELALATATGIEFWALGPAGRSPRAVGSLATPLGSPRSLAYAPDGSFLFYTQACHVRMVGRP